MTWVVVAVMLFCDRDVAPIFGHLSTLAGGAAMRRPFSPRSRRRSPSRASRPRTRRSVRDLAADAVAARRSHRGGRAPLRPDGDDHVPGDRGVHGRRAQGLGPRRRGRRRPRRPRAAHRPEARRGVHGALARDVVRRAHGLGRLHLRHRRHAAAADGGVRLDGPEVDGRRRALGVLRRARARCSARPGSGCSSCASRCRRASRTASTASPPPAGSRCSTSASRRS